LLGGQGARGRGGGRRHRPAAAASLSGNVATGEAESPGRGGGTVRGPALALGVQRRPGRAPLLPGRRCRPRTGQRRVSPTRRSSSRTAVASVRGRGAVFAVVTWRMVTSVEPCFATAT